MTVIDHAVDHPPTVLARVEFARLLRHPAFVGFTALSVLMQVIGFFERGDVRSNVLYDMVANGPPFWVPSGIGLAIAAGLAATRARRDDLDELFDTTPVVRSARVDALLMAILGVGILAAIGVLAFVTAAGGWNGLPFLIEPDRTVWGDFPIGTVIEPTDVTPSLFELASGPTALVVWGLFGVVVARYLGSRILIIAAPLIGFIQLIVVTWTPSTGTRWLWPFTHSARYVGWLDLSDGGTGAGVATGFNVAAVGWHVLYLVALATLLFVVGRRQRSTGSRDGWVAVAAVIVGTAAIVAQLATYAPDLHSP